MENILDVFQREGLGYTKDLKDYLAERASLINAAKEASIKFSNRPVNDVRADIGTALSGIIGGGGKIVVLGADGQTSCGYQKYKMDSKKIYQIDKFTIASGTGDVVFIHDIVRIFEADVNFIQMAKSDGTFVSPNGKATILSDLVKSIMGLNLYFGIGAGFLLGLYDPKDEEARLFHIFSDGCVVEQDIAAYGCGQPWVISILNNHYKELGEREISLKNMIKLSRKAIDNAITFDSFCGGKKMLCAVDKNGARGVR